jgi:hypothetical protein
VNGQRWLGPFEPTPHNSWPTGGELTAFKEDTTRFDSRDVDSSGDRLLLVAIYTFGRGHGLCSHEPVTTLPTSRLGNAEDPLESATLWEDARDREGG